MHITRDERGSVRTILGVGVLVVLLVAAASIAVWALLSRQNYKNNSDAISAKAVESALSSQKAELEAQFSEQEKEPYETYNGPSEFGSLSVSYPKTWEAYVNITNGSTPIDGYVHPNYVPGTSSSSGAQTAYALRFQVIESDYATVLKTYEGALKQSKVSVSPFRAEKVTSVLGSRVEGEVVAGRTGDMVVVPLRDKTLKVWTESDQYKSDFDQIIKTLNFSP